MTTQEILGRFEAVSLNGDGWMARCPAHDDENPSLSIDVGDDGCTLLKCHAGCATEAVVEALGIEMKDLFPKSDGPLGESVAEYEYCDEAGEVLFRVSRFNPKTFRQSKPDGSRGWIWNVKGVRKVLYRLPEVREAAAAGGLIFLVEGEKDANRLTDDGLVATTCAGGAGKWRPEYVEALKGAGVVVILPDNDDIGREHAQAVARSIHQEVRCVRVVELPGVPAGGDVSDWMQIGGTVSHLLRLVCETPDWSPEKRKRKFPSAFGPREIHQRVAKMGPITWRVSGLIPTDANVLLAGHPKSGKTMIIEDLALSVASGTPFLGRFPTERGRAGLVLMEDTLPATERRLLRMCRARGISFEDLEGSFFLWSRPRPPLSLGDETVRELGDYAEEYGLDLLVIDSWSFVATGNSDRADEVVPQLMSLSALRERRPGLTIGLVHHVRKSFEGSDPDAARLTDLIRNSSAFGAWFDAGLVVARRNERAPIKLRAELRDLPAFEPVVLMVEDEHPGRPEEGRPEPEGWLRIRVTDEEVEEAHTREQAERAIPRIRKVLKAAEGQTIASRKQLRDKARIAPATLLTALEIMAEKGEIAISENGAAKSTTLVGEVE